MLGNESSDGPLSGGNCGSQRNMLYVFKLEEKTLYTFTIFKKGEMCPREIDRWLRAHTALTEDPISVSSTHIG